MFHIHCDTVTLHCQVELTLAPVSLFVISFTYHLPSSTTRGHSVNTPSPKTNDLSLGRSIDHFHPVISTLQFQWCINEMFTIVIQVANLNHLQGRNILYVHTSPFIKARRTNLQLSQLGTILHREHVSTIIRVETVHSYLNALKFWETVNNKLIHIPERVISHNE